jgi:hypothetical protein
MSLDEGPKRRFGRIATASEEFQQATIGHRAQRPLVKEHADLVAKSECRIPVRHDPTRSFSVTKLLDPSYLNRGAPEGKRSRFLDETAPGGYRDRPPVFEVAKKVRSNGPDRAV